MDVSKVTSKTPVSAPAAEEEEKRRVFKHNTPSCYMYTPTGRAIIFVRGRFITDDPELIEYLKSEVGKGSGVYVDKDEEIYDPKVHDPIASLRHSLRMELLKEMAEENARASGNPNRNMGNYGNVNTAGIGSTQDLSAISAGTGQAVPVTKVSSSK